MTLAVIDTETLGLDADRHDVWEVALILHDPPDRDGKSQPDREYLWQLPLDGIAHAEPIALRISRFYERRWPNAETDDEAHGALLGQAKYVVNPSDMYAWADQLCRLTDGAHVLGAVPSFDTIRLEALIEQYDRKATWHYHLIDVETLAVGYLIGRWAQQLDNAHETADIIGTPGRPDVEEGPFQLDLPWKSRQLSKIIGVDPDAHLQHSALGDARWALDLYRKISGETA